MMYVIGITGWRRKRTLLIRVLLLALLLLALFYASWFSSHAVDADVFYPQPELADEAASTLYSAATAEAYWELLALQLSE